MLEEEALHSLMKPSSFVETLFDRIPEVVFFIKDEAGRYRMVNQTLVVRCGRRSKNDLLGRTAREVFPSPLGERFLEQDLRVVETAAPIHQNLELHLYPTRIEGWCLTDKEPLRKPDGRVIGLAGISRDLQAPGESGEGYSELASVVEYIRARFGRELRVHDLAQIAGMSVYQLNRRLRAIFGITASQLITKTRIEHASESLRESSSLVAEIAQACGYCDQSAFSRVCRRTVGLTPLQYRERHHPEGKGSRVKG